MTADVKCVNCNNYKLSSTIGSAKQMSNLGFGLCAFEKNTATYYAARYARQCHKFIEAIPATIRKRLIFLNNEGLNHEI